MISDAQGGRTATLDSDWNDLGDRHILCRETIESSIQRFPDEPVEATYIVGAIGAGKSQLLLHGFKYAWQQAGKPAIYLDLSDLIDGFQKRAKADGYDLIPQSTLHDYYEEICIENLRQIRRKIEEDQSLDSTDFLPRTRRRPSATEYFENLGVDNPAEIAKKEDQLIVFVDEMEDGYERLKENTEGTTGPLRRIVDEIDKGNSRAYLIGAFGYASAHELGEAEARRVNSINLPIIRPRQIHQILEIDLDAGTENYAWWHSRGRPGWIQAALDTKVNLLDGIEGHYDGLFDITTQRMSRVEVLDREALNVHFKSLGRESRDFLAYLLTNPRPFIFSEFDSPSRYQALVEAEASTHVLCDSELTPTEDIYSTVESGLRNLDAYHEGVSTSQLDQFGTRVLNSIADSNGGMVFGHVASPTPAHGDRALDLVLRPLVRRMHDIALEELGSEDSDTVEFLYAATQKIEQSQAQDLFQEFKEFFNLFDSTGDLTTETRVSIDLGTPSIAFPSLITNPRLSFGGTATNTDEQYDQLVNRLETIQEGPERLHEFGHLLLEDPR